jgi:hypothetical protein
VCMGEMTTLTINNAEPWNNNACAAMAREYAHWEKKK